MFQFRFQDIKSKKSPESVYWVNLFLGFIGLRIGIIDNAIDSINTINSID